ncbi:hypothetical protein [Ruegeria sp.]|uniref:hypothetical protein n=1 Tax=Ruegeria sp. TaxID=1879320 RepID=UPI003B5AA59B
MDELTENKDHALADVFLSFEPIGLGAFTKASGEGFDLGVRRQEFWASWQSELRENLTHPVRVIMRRICGEASDAFRLSFV